VQQGLGHEGNLVLVEVASDTAFRMEVEDRQGIDRLLKKGDHFIGVLASRHSGTSESGDVPETGIRIDDGIELHLLSAGGVVGISSGMPAGGHKPMSLKAVGLVTDSNGVVDIFDAYGAHDAELNATAPVILVCGTSAEVGKTTSAAGLIGALSRCGLSVAATKLTGTGRRRDIDKLRDAGAHEAMDFPEIGLATTYTSPDRFMAGTYTLLNRLNASKPDIIVAEAGGDLIEANVPTFLASAALMHGVKAIVIVAGDVMGMMGAVSYIRKYAPEAAIYLTEPKGRNPITTRERVMYELPGLTIFNSLSVTELDTVARKILYA